MIGWRHTETVLEGPECAPCADGVWDPTLPPGGLVCGRNGCLAPVESEWCDEHPPCIDPQPDPASPCGYEGCPLPEDQPWHDMPGRQWSPVLSPRFSHPHVATRCLNCGHGLEPRP